MDGGGLAEGEDAFGRALLGHLDGCPGELTLERDNARLRPLAAVDESLGPFDTVLIMCGDFGLMGADVDAILRRLHALVDSAAGWRLASVVHTEPPDYYAVAEKA